MKFSFQLSHAIVIVNHLFVALALPCADLQDIGQIRTADLTLSNLFWFISISLLPGCRDIIRHSIWELIWRWLLQCLLLFMPGHEGIIVIVVVAVLTITLAMVMQFNSHISTPAAGLIIFKFDNYSTKSWLDELSFNRFLSNFSRALNIKNLSR